MAPKIHWEWLDDWTARARLNGVGWLVQQSSPVMVSMHEDMPKQDGYEWRNTTTFVPDALGVWKLEDDAS